MTNAIHRRILAFALAIAVMIAFTPAIAFTQSASAATRPGKVLWSSITKTPTTVTLKWQKASKAKGYSVYQKKSGKYKKIKTTTKRTYTTKKLKAFKSYSFKVRAYRMSGGKKVYGKYSSAKKVTTAASKITGVTITSSASSVSAGSNVTFTATVTGGTKPLKYQWYKDGALIEGATDSTYTAALSSSDSGAKFTCKVTGPDGKSLTSEEAGSVTVYNTVTRTVVKSWNIGATNGTTDYDPNANSGAGNGTSDVVATLYSDGELAVTGSGDTVVFGDATSGTGAYKTPWNLDGKTKDVKSATIASGVTPTNMGHWYEGCAITAAPAIPSNVEDMDSTFQGCDSLTTAPDISGCTQLTNMYETFDGCTALTTAPTIPSSVTDMTSTFSSCIALTGTMLIKTNTTNYNGCFAFVAINSGTNLKVNYTSTSESFVNAIISTCGPSGTFSRGNITKAFTSVTIADQTASSGTATFTAAVDATVTITSYQWQKSTDGGKTFTALSDGTGITGATSGTLSLTGLTTSDNGNIYRCVVKDNSTPAKEAYGEGTLTVTTP